MDFIEGLLNLKAKDTILVVVDLLTMYGYFLTLLHPFTTLTMAQEYLTHIYKLHGTPKQLYLIGTGYSSVNFGKNCSKSLAQVIRCPQPITLKLMAKQRFSIDLRRLA